MTSPWWWWSTIGTSAVKCRDEDQERLIGDAADRMSNVSDIGPVRTRRACEPCRRKKVRCPGEKPVCAFCRRLNQRCTYGPRRERYTNEDIEPVDELEVSRLSVERLSHWHLSARWSSSTTSRSCRITAWTVTSIRTVSSSVLDGISVTNWW